MKRKAILFLLVAIIVLLATCSDAKAWFAYRYGYAGGVGVNPYAYGGYHYGAYGGYRYGYARRW
jgi:hypothetical protein